MNTVYSTTAASNLIGVSAWTLRDWDRRGVLRASLRCDVGRLYTPDDIERGRAIKAARGRRNGA